ncbi:MAG: Gfo/Idh/MocA family oxidoreductase [Lentisphaeria bacterium]|nr:Gfo/Idh/MocA family oxidoreductase [Lentisphaeria bacterium]
MAKKLRAALIGFGGMGHFHANCYAKQKNVELVAICDIDKKKFEVEKEKINIGESEKTDLSGIAKYHSYEELVRKAEFDLLDICLPCHLHAEYAVRAMKDGYHVLCEKPMARTLAQADRMIRIARETNRKLMIAHCLRFAPNLVRLKEMIEKKEFGKLLRLDMRRVGALPKNKWYRDPAKSGGALLDLHLHDTDFVNFALGLPASVRTYGIERDTGGIDDLMTAYQYSRGPVVNSEGSWCKGTWKCSIVAVFQKATVEVSKYDLLTVFRLDQEPEEIKFGKNTNPYFNEIAYFAECILKNREPERCLPKSTRDSIRIAGAEERSARAKRTICLR